MRLAWYSDAWEDYLYWQTHDKKILKKINGLIKDIERNGYTGIGKPEPLKKDLASWWSRRINDTDRVIYRIDVSIPAPGKEAAEQNISQNLELGQETCLILQCKGH
ncbi:MAG: Txe/YoeB family addiction module toxin [Desulfarculales bacterium]|jgi:toxin YoeB|nr:Txe/YoeB family addiction module toxin [Desulfarculales bacterium]